jgi:hypothetical protein
MTIASKSGGLILKDGALATNCGCCGGWYCCPSLYTVSVSYDIPDFETSIPQGSCPGSLFSWSLLRVTSSALNTISDQTYKAVGGGSKAACGSYAYLLDSFGAGSSSGPTIPAGSAPIVDSFSFNALSGLMGSFRVILPSEFTQLSTDVRCRSCTAIWSDGPVYGNMAFSTGDYIQPVTIQGSGFFSPTNTRFLPKAMLGLSTGDTQFIESMHSPPNVYQWTMYFFAGDPSECVGFGPPLGVKDTGSITVTATAGCD